MATQLPRAERLARADDVIDNSGPARRASPPQVAALDRRYRALAARHAATRGAVFGQNAAPFGRMTP